MMIRRRSICVAIFALAVACGASTPAQILFQPFPLSIPVAEVTADFNGDGKADIVAANGGVEFGNGDGTFTAGTGLKKAVKG